MRGRLKLFFSFFGLLIAAPTQAGTVDVIPAKDGVPAIILVQGQLTIEDSQTFTNAALANSNAIVGFNSEGGRVLAGIEIGKAIRLKGFTTVVLDGSRCLSACALAWLGGTKRFASPDSKIGFHAAYLENQGSKEVTAVGNALVGAYLNQLGLSTSAVAYITAAAPSDMQWLNFSDAKRLGIDVEATDPTDKSTTMAGPRPNPPAPATPAPQPPPVQAAPQQLQATLAPAAPSQPVKPPGYFSDYTVPSFYSGPRAPPVLDTNDKYSFRTRLRQAAASGPIFAGRFGVGVWGCGTACVTGAVVDTISGAVTFFPGTFSGWGQVDDNFRAIEFRSNSRLIIFSGMLNEEQPIGSHYFSFDGSRFNYIATVVTSDDFKRQFEVRRVLNR